MSGEMPPKVPRMEFGPEMLGKILESPIVGALQERAEEFESGVKSALHILNKKIDRIEQKLNLLSGELLNRP